MLDSRNAHLFFLAFREQITEIARKDKGLETLINWTTTKSSNLPPDIRTTARILYIIIPLYHNAINLSLTCLLLSRNDDLPKTISDVLISRDDISQAWNETRSSFEGLQFTFELELRKANEIAYTCDLLKDISESFHSQFATFISTDDITNLYTEINQEIASIATRVKDLVDSISEAYVESTAEFFEADMEGFTKEEILQHAISHTLLTAKEQAFETNGLIIVAVRKVSHIIRRFLALLSSRTIASVDLRSLFSDIIGLKLWILFDTLSTIIRNDPEGSGTSAKPLAYDILRHIDDTLALRISQQGTVFGNDDADDATDEPVDIWQAIHEHVQDSLQRFRNIGYYWECDSDLLKTYVDANFVFLECLEIATVEDRASLEMQVFTNS